MLEPQREALVCFPCADVAFYDLVANFVVSIHSRDLDKMAEDREPPPLFEDEQIVQKTEDNEDLFTSVSEVCMN